MTTPNLPAITDEYTLKEFGWTKNQFEIIQRMYFKNLSTDQISVFGYICKKTGLDPFVKQIYAIVRGGVLCAQTGIDGYRVIAERTLKYSPGKEPVFKEENGVIISCTAFVKKMTNDGTWHEIAATAYLKEYTTGAGFWIKMPHGQLAKCAEALALRKAFPDFLAAVYTKEEMDQAGPSDDEKLQQAECEDVTKPNKPAECPKIDDIAPSMTIETKLDKESLGILLDTLRQVDAECLTNFNKWMQDKYGSKNHSDLPQKMFQPVMNGFSNNILKNKGLVV